MYTVANWTNLSSTSYERLVSRIGSIFENYKEVKKKKLTEDELLTICANMILSKIISVNLVLFFLKAVNFIPSQMNENDFTVALDKKIETIRLFKEVDELHLKADRFLVKLKKARKKRKNINTQELWRKS